MQVEFWKIVCTLYSLEHSLAPLPTFRAQAFFRHKTSSETHRTVQVPVQMGHLTGLATGTQNTVNIPYGNLCSFSVWTTRGLQISFLIHLQHFFSFCGLTIAERGVVYVTLFPFFQKHLACLKTVQKTPLSSSSSWKCGLNMNLDVPHVSCPASGIVPQQQIHCACVG